MNLSNNNDFYYVMVRRKKIDGLNGTFLRSEGRVHGLEGLADFGSKDLFLLEYSVEIGGGAHCARRTQRSVG
jgi:hypothetical protein